MAFANPKEILVEFGLQPGDSVADFGCGTGFYTVAAADMVGDDGKVFAIEIQQELLTKARSLDSKKRENIEFIAADIESPKDTQLQSDSLDAVFLSNVLFQLEDKNAALTEAYRVLKHGGRLLVVDWTDSFGSLGPEQKYIIGNKKATALAEEVGFVLERNIEQPGDHHYGLVFVKP